MGSSANIIEAQKPIDISKILPGGIPKQPDSKSPMMKLYIDQEGFVTFPDGSRYKGGLDQGIPDGDGIIIYTDGSEYDGEWR